MDFKHIIWDFDGTLFNTYPHTAQAFLVMLRKEYLVHENVNEIEKHMRISLQHAYDFYTEKFEIDDDFIEKYNDFRILYENQHTLPANDAYLVCKFVFDQGSLNYLYTHRDKSALSMMQKHGFNNIFRDFITSDNGFPKKPAPDALLHLIEKHNMNKEEILYIGDRGVDLECANKTGVKFCLFTPNVNNTLNADFAVQNFSDLYYILNSTLSTRDK
ncbi:MAG: HAD-IA family hydrolase [Oscillospiraceae bacterium]|jgi:phosphoglycolate phosphatase-like HAD superfamily hydrolase|nr:HAD-IA family hydrolase [Oscillospiraceae bacterium]